MKQSQPYAFVLWGEDFEEVPTTILAGALRRAGIRVKVVALNAQRTKGACGLTLLPDITLDQALRLAEHAVCVIIPSDLEHLQQFSDDPRIAELLRRARNNNAKMIAGRLPSNGANYVASLLWPIREMIELPESDELFDFASQMADSLIPISY